MAETSESWLQVAGVPLPERLSLRCVDAANMGDLAESRIRDGYTQREIDAGVRMLDCIEVIEQWQPVNPRSVALRMCLHIGWRDDPGTDHFHLYLVTNDLRSHIYSNRIASFIFVDEFVWPKVLASFLNTIRMCDRTTWEASVEELRKRFDWEYEGMP